MTVKMCGRCGSEKPLSEFNSKGKNKTQPYCRPCDNQHAREYYAKHGERMRRQINDARKKRISVTQNEIRQIKESSPCLDCGKKYPYYVMDFDHTNGEKEYNVSEMIGSGLSKSKIIKEINKCEIVCSNCHRERTYQRNQSPRV